MKHYNITINVSGVDFLYGEDYYFGSEKAKQELTRENRYIYKIKEHDCSELLPGISFNDDTFGCPHYAGNSRFNNLCKCSNIPQGLTNKELNALILDNTAILLLMI